MRDLFVLLIFLSFGRGVACQSVYNVRETLYLPERAAAGVIYTKLPLDVEGQSVSQLRFSEQPAGGQENAYRWEVDPIRPRDSLHLSYRVRVTSTPAWDPDNSAMTDGAINWPPLEEGTVALQYALPPLVREDIDKTEFGTLEPGDTTVEAVNRLIRRLGRRVKTVRNPEAFDYDRPLLEDVYRRSTTARRKHLLLSLALQYLDLPHRVVAGKVLSYGEVRENELWVEIPVGGRWFRVYYGDGVDRSEWGPPLEADQFLACSFDWRDYTLEVVSAPGEPFIETTLWGEYSNVVLDFWTAKDEALGRKQYARAVTYLDSILQYSPQSVVTIAEIGLVYTQAGRPEEGLPYLQRAFQLSSTSEDRSTAMLQMAKYFSLQDQTEEALKALAQAYRPSPIDLSVIFSDVRFQNLARLDRLEQRLTAYLQSAGD
ncbi:tetratricopeptide (TPR) repeat protein [Lewinella aquimaris]|uniref:Tetratricopeptide (TPR) repeat protein n=1 Tax=Neolewinella aquimaris TaxID=1835722 RepID=A0A840E997_9BACT|nr:tetratricopeptide repeat protein [Neolewinella aquimaris]MBB4080513.1 tetratricopeptide (TPR) repeat protein [Neolewinella aquimaris]